MGVTTVQEVELEQRTRLAFGRTIALLRAVDPSLPLIDSEWTCGGVAAHLLDVIHRYTERDFQAREGLTGSPDELAQDNRVGVDRHLTMSHAEVLDRIEAEFPRYLALDLPLHERFPFHAGQTIDGAGARSNWMGELLLHGYDVARAAHRPWPLDPRDMTLVLNGALQVAPGWLDPKRAAGADLTIAVRITGSKPQLFRIVDGACEVRDQRSGDRVDSVIHAPPVPLALLMYHRITLMAAARRGVLVVGGRKPWVGLRLPGMFVPA